MKISFGKATQMIIGFSIALIALIFAYGTYSNMVVEGIVSFIILMTMSTMLISEVILERKRGKNIGIFDGFWLIIAIAGYVFAFVSAGYIDLPPDLSGIAIILFVGLAVGIVIEMFKV